MGIFKPIFYSLIFLYLFFSSSSCFSYYSPKIIKFGIVDIPSGTGTNPIGSTLDFDITTNPLFPNIVELPSIGDVISKRPGYAFIGSNPTFEVRLNIKSNDIDIKTVDLADASGKAFKSIPFKTSKVKDTNDKLLITISIPDSISAGSSLFTLNLSDGSSLYSEIEMISFLKIKVKKTKQFLGKPSINRLSAKKDKDVFTVSARGKNFAPKNIIYFNNSVQNESSDPENTRVTILPNTLNAEILEVDFEDIENLKIKFTFPEALKEATDIVIIVTTPRGITSKELTIDKKFIFF
jgi:hypothetical protein